MAWLRTANAVHSAGRAGTAAILVFRNVQLFSQWRHVAACGWAGLLIACTWLTQFDLLSGQYVTYGFVTFPLFLIILGSSTALEKVCQHPIPGAAIWRVLSDHAYAFFMVQIFLWTPVLRIKQRWPQAFVTHGNRKAFLLAVALAFLATVLLQDLYNTQIQKAVKKIRGKISE